MIIKSKEERNNIITAAKINSECLLYLRSLVAPGIDSEEINQKAEEFYAKHKVTPAFKGYHGYPATINFMINEQVVHCIPSKTQIVKEGDIVSIDTGCIYNGFYADQALSMGVGRIKDTYEKLLETARISVQAGCAQAIAGRTTGDIGYAQQMTIELAGFSVVKKFVGHEIGRSLHERIKLPGFGEPSTGEVLEENLVLCVENQVCEFNNDVEILNDGWTTVTKDGGMCATFEHMIIVGRKKPQIITLPT